MSTLIAVFAAVGAGMLLATGGILQQRATSRRPAGERRLALHIVTDRTWLLGIAAAAGSYGMQAVALSFGPLALVQPLLVTELVFAVPVSVRLRKLRLRARDWISVGAVAGGLAVSIVAADPRGGDPPAPFPVWVVPLAVVGGLAGLGVAVARFARGPARATALATAGAVVMAMQSALYNATIALKRPSGWRSC
jgi:drug/metabolite transporter (DMT)-like permease